MKYGQLPKILGTHIIDVKEMFFYQYLPIKVPGNHIVPVYEDRLKVFDSIIGSICCDYIGQYGLNNYVNSYIYVSAKHLYQSPGKEYNRPGWHSDGFMTDDVNYIWSNNTPTIFSQGNFKLTMDDELSLSEMENQAHNFPSVSFEDNLLIRLDQFNIHKVGTAATGGLRAFLKVSFSKDQYNLLGNSHNGLIDYEWPMLPRSIKRNQTQKDDKQ